MTSGITPAQAPVDEGTASSRALSNEVTEYRDPTEVYDYMSDTTQGSDAEMNVLMKQAAVRSTSPETEAGTVSNE